MIFLSFYDGFVVDQRFFFTFSIRFVCFHHSAPPVRRFHLDWRNLISKIPQNHTKFKPGSVVSIRKVAVKHHPR